MFSDSLNIGQVYRAFGVQNSNSFYRYCTFACIETSTQNRRAIRFAHATGDVNLYSRTLTYVVGQYQAKRTGLLAAIPSNYYSTYYIPFESAFSALSRGGDVSAKKSIGIEL